MLKLGEIVKFNDKIHGNRKFSPNWINKYFIVTDIQCGIVMGVRETIYNIDSIENDLTKLKIRTYLYDYELNLVDKVNDPADNDSVDNKSYKQVHPEDYKKYYIAYESKLRGNIDHPEEIKELDKHMEILLSQRMIDDEKYLTAKKKTEEIRAKYDAKESVKNVEYHNNYNSYWTEPINTSKYIAAQHRASNPCNPSNNTTIKKHKHLWTNMFAGEDKK